MSPRLRELLWQRIDGELSTAEQEWLDARLAEDPVALEEAEAVSLLAGALDGMADEEPPAELRPRIDAALARARRPRRPAADAPASGGRGGRVLAGIFGRPARPAALARLAYLAAGLLLGAVGYHYIAGGEAFREPMDVRDLYGSMRPPAEVAGADRLELPGAAGLLWLSRSGRTLVLELLLAEGGADRDAAPMTVRLSGGGGVELVHLDEGTPSATEIRRHGGVLELGGLEAGSYLAGFEVADPAAAIELHVSAAGAELGRFEVRLAELPATSPPTFPDGSR